MSTTEETLQVIVRSADRVSGTDTDFQISLHPSVIEEVTKYSHFYLSHYSTFSNFYNVGEGAYMAILLIRYDTSDALDRAGSYVLKVPIPAGSYSGTTLATTLASAISTAVNGGPHSGNGFAAFTCTVDFSESTQRYTISVTSQMWRFGTHSNNDHYLFSIMTKGQNLTGFTYYNGDVDLDSVECMNGPQMGFYSISFTTSITSSDYNLAAVSYVSTLPSCIASVVGVVMCSDLAGQTLMSTRGRDNALAVLAVGSFGSTSFFENSNPLLHRLNGDPSFFRVYLKDFLTGDSLSTSSGCSAFVLTFIKKDVVDQG